MKTQAKQLRVSALVTIYPLQQGFAGGGLENTSWRCVYSIWKFLHSSWLGGEWDNAHPSVNITQRRWRSCWYLLSKMEMPAGATGWAKPVGMWAGTVHACPGSCASSPPPWPHTAPGTAALSPAPAAALCRRKACFDSRIMNVPQLHSCKIPGETRHV